MSGVHVSSCRCYLACLWLTLSFLLRRQSLHHCPASPHIGEGLDRSLCIGTRSGVSVKVRALRCTAIQLQVATSACSPYAVMPAALYCKASCKLLPLFCAMQHEALVAQAQQIAVAC